MILGVRLTIDRSSDLPDFVPRQSAANFHVRVWDPSLLDASRAPFTAASAAASLAFRDLIIKHGAASDLQRGSV